MKPNDLLLREMFPDRRGAQLRGQLSQVPGVQLCDSHHARWKSGEATSELCWDALGDIRVTLPGVPPATSLAALQMNAGLPANCRWAAECDGLVLQADIDSSHLDRLPQVFRELEEGIRIASPNQAADSRQEPEPAMAASAIEAALRERPWDDQSVVKLPQGWELRPRCGHPVAAVTMSVEGTRVRLRRSVLTGFADGVPGEAVCHQALRFNSQVKHARLTCVAGEIVAEACVQRELLDGTILDRAARAVVLADRLVGITLGILRSQEDIAAQYVAMFLER